MKHDAIVEQGIPIKERIPIPDEMIPADSRVEIDAKIHAGSANFHRNFVLLEAASKHSFPLLTRHGSYFTTGKVLSMEELSAVQGRAWGKFPMLLDLGKLLGTNVLIEDVDH
jgi:hypothetical protein